MSPEQSVEEPAAVQSSRPSKKNPLVAAVACEPCRKRKVRCSGTAPCTICQRQMVDCYFNYHRRRRGPRTKKQLSAAEVQVDSTSNDQQTGNRSDVPAQDEHSTPISKPAISMSSVESWRTGLSIIMEVEKGESYPVASQIIVSMDLVIHLILVYCTTVNIQQIPVLSYKEFLKLLEVGDCSRSLCHAMCAISVKYSRHRLTKKAGSKLAERFAQDARQALSTSLLSQDPLDRAQTLAVLSMYESAEGAGFQAWYDITTACSLLPHINEFDSRSQYLVKSIETLKRHATLAEIFPTLGHRKLSIHKLFLSHLLREDEKFDMEGVAPNIAFVLSKLFDLVLRVHSLLQVDFTKHLPAPWSPSSEFTSIKRQLDTLQVRFNEEINFTEQTFLHFSTEEGGAGEYLMCSLTWHYCVILMNRVFLPIRINLGTENTDPGTPSTRSMMKKLYFPSGPRSFLQERATACYTSANSIVRICSLVLKIDPFMLPPFMGYCCFQSGLALIDQLYSRDSDDLSSVIEGLKTTFTIIGAMRSYFAPAQLWVDALFKAHTEDKIVKTPSLSLSSIFSHYFARFYGLKEPPFVPLEMTQVVQEDTLSPQPIVEADKDGAAIPVNNEAETLQTQSESRTWISEYQRNLRENISMLDTTTGVPIAETQETSSESLHRPPQNTNIMVPNESSSNTAQLELPESEQLLQQSETSGSVYTSEGSEQFHESGNQISLSAQDELAYPMVEFFLQSEQISNVSDDFSNVEIWNLDMFTNIDMEQSLALGVRLASSAGAGSASDS